MPSGENRSASVTTAQAVHNMLVYGSLGFPQCGYCGNYHVVGMCPRVEEIEYYPEGTVKRVKLRAP